MDFFEIMSLHYLIDGYNVARHEAFKSNLPVSDERLALLELISRYRLCGSPANKVSVVFDGFPPEFGWECPYRGLNVVFSGEKSADDVVIEMTFSSLRPKAIAVVSADNRITSEAASRGAMIISPQQFLSKVGRAGALAKEEKENGRPITTQQQTRINEEFSKLWLKKKQE